MTTIPTVYNVGATATGTGAITPALPASPEPGDLQIMFLETGNQAITVANWTAATSGSVGDATDVTMLTVYYRRWVSGDAAQVTSDSGDHQIGQIVGIRGAIRSGNPFEVVGTGTAASSATGTATAVTTTGTNRLIINAVGVTTDLTSTANFSAWTNANLSSVTERCDALTTAGSGGGFGVATGGLAAAGGSGGTTVTLANAARKVYWTAAIIPDDGVRTLNDAGTCSTTLQATAPLEIQDFKANTQGIGPKWTINSVTITGNWFASSAGMGGPIYELWDGTTAQIGNDLVGTASTDPRHTDSATITGVTYAQLATLRVRIYPQKGTAAAGDTFSVDYVSIAVNATADSTPDYFETGRGTDTLSVTISRPPMPRRRASPAVSYPSSSSFSR